MRDRKPQTVTVTVDQGRSERYVPRGRVVNNFTN